MSDILSYSTTPLLDGCRKAFDDAAWPVEDESFSPDFLSNVPQEGVRVLRELRKEMDMCTDYAISVAFVTMGGWQPMAQSFANADADGKKGRLLTTDYLFFTQPEALRRLALLNNLEVRFFRTGGRQGFHTKGYIFRSPDVYRIILGSSNLTQTALTTSREWNARLVTKETGAFARKMLAEFETLWNAPETLPLDKVIDDYEKAYREHWRSGAVAAVLREEEALQSVPEPNKMQRTFVDNVLKLIGSGKKRGLLISATGTGKTYAAAFAAREIKPKKALFLVHREQILRQAQKSFSRVLGPSKKTALYTGTQHDNNVLEADVVFATMQTLSRETHSAVFGRDHFDLIIIDEVHRAGAKSYGKIMDYFTPAFWLGMTASPDRPDGVDIYQLFDHNIAYEIRLQTALEEDMLCPFHYFGVADVTLSDGERLADVADVKKIPLGQRVNYMLEKVNFFGHSGRRVKGLVFCSTVKEAEEMSAEFNRRGLSTLALSGADSQEKRADAIARLSQEKDYNRLDYLFSVDLLNEGVDIPEANMVIFNRPTESAIIFVQQLGRGLRKAKDKEFVTVIDFIGNYNQNFLIPVALSGDNSYDKTKIRKFIHTDKDNLRGASTIQFDRIAEKTIYRLIDKAKTNEMKLLKDSYLILKNKLGRIPTLTDFDEHNGIDPCKFFDKKELGSYYAFLRKVEPTYKVRLTELAEGMLAFLSGKLGHAQRPSEMLVIDDILSGRRTALREKLSERLAADYGFTASKAHLHNVELVLSGDFLKTADEKKKAAKLAVLERDSDFRVREAFLDELGNPHFRSLLRELVDFVLLRYRRLYSARYKDTMFVLNECYTYEDVCRLLDWTRHLSAQNIGGYFYDKESKTLPVFINYEKGDGAIQYEDRFLSDNRLVALSKTKRRIDSPDADHIYKRKAEDRDNQIFLFVRRNKDDKEAKSFYFLGEMQADPAFGPIAVELPADESREKAVNAFEIHYKLETPVRADVFHYLTEGNI